MFHTLGAAKNAIGIGETEPELRVQTEKELVRNCHRIIAATEREKEELIGYYRASPEKISVIPCGVNLDLFQPVDKGIARRKLGFDDCNIILFVGRIEPLKGIDQLLQAMTYLENASEAKLVIIGGDNHSQPEMERLQRLSHELHIKDSTTFMGTVRQEELPSFYSAADVCVIPSYHESFGLVALESLACGTPVVAARVGGVDDVINQGRTGYVTIDNEPQRLAGRIAALLSTPVPGTESASKIRASVARYSWSNIADEIIGEYRALLGSCVAQPC
jgi:D-inositol-3-phosphate glycosyltransferase